MYHELQGRTKASVAKRYNAPLGDVIMAKWAIFTDDSGRHGPDRTDMSPAAKADVMAGVCVPSMPNHEDLVNLAIRAGMIDGPVMFVDGVWVSPTEFQTS